MFITTMRIRRPKPATLAHCRITARPDHHYVEVLIAGERRAILDVTIGPEVLWTSDAYSGATQKDDLMAAVMPAIAAMQHANHSRVRLPRAA